MKRPIPVVSLMLAISAIPITSDARPTGAGKLTITTSYLPAGTVGVAYGSKIAVSGGSSHYTYSAINLPSGLSINSSTGTVSGAPANSSAGTKTVAITVKDSTQPTALSATSSLSLTISAAGSAVSCGNLSTGNLGSLNGYLPFPSSDAWNTNIAVAPVDPNSASIISALGLSSLHPDFSTPAGGNYGIPYVVVNSHSTPLVSVDMVGYPSESDIALYPIPGTAPIEGAPGNCSSNGDNHLIVVDSAKCWIYETWATQHCNGSWSASNGAIWDMTNSERRPYGWTSADAAGLPIFPGLVRFDEVASGAIKHAIRVTLNNTKSDLHGGYFVTPATHAAGNSSSTHNIIGMRLRLKSSVNISTFSARNQVILRAMQQYGLIVADNGSNLFFQGTPDARWNDSDLNALKSINASEFEVVQMGPAYDSSTAPIGLPPAISSFTATQTTVKTGTTVTLKWNVTGSSYNFIDTVGAVRSASQTVTPKKTTTYTLNSTNQFGRSTKQVVVNVR